MDFIYNTLAKYQNYLLGFAIFLALCSVANITTGRETKLVLGNYPVLMFLLVVASLGFGLLYIHIDKRKIANLSEDIMDLNKDENADFKKSLAELTARQLEVYE